MSNEIIKSLIDKIGNYNVLTDKELSDRYTHIWKMSEPLSAKCVALPKTTKEVSDILKICHAHQQPVVVHGGLTNLVGGTNTHKNEVVIYLEKMNQIEEIDEQSRTITVQAGMILENVHTAVKDKNLLFPLNFGAKGSAQIGGIISTNAGGLRVFRYGMTRNLVLGLEAVLADGTIVSSLKKIIKDNSAYDLKQLFIGAEGTLGIVTKAVLKLVEAPKSRNSAFVAFNEYDKVIDFLKYMDSGLAGTLSGFELIWKKCYEGMTTPPAKMKPPLPYSYNYYVLMESLGNHQENDRQKMQDLLETAFEKELILDAVLAHSDSDLAWFWTIREDVHAIVSQANNDHHFDISLPISKIGEVIPMIEAELYKIPEVEVVYCFGHVADGNIHLVIGKENDSKTLTEQINKVVYAPLKALGGSVSAEHGIGVDKKAYLHLCRSEAEIDLMKTMKRTLDPNNILNQGKIFDID